MNPVLQKDIEQLPAILQSVAERVSTYLGSLDSRRVSNPAPVTNAPVLPADGLGYAATQELFDDGFLQHIVASSGPRYWGFVTGGTTPASIAGDWLAAVYDQNTQGTQTGGDVSARLEFDAIQLLLQLFDLPADFMGAFVTGATMSNFTGLAVARQWMGKQQGRDIALQGIGDTKMKVYTAVPHSSAIKCLSMLGIGSGNIQSIPVLPGRECMDTAAFEAMLADAPGEPFILVASGGTVNTVDFDDMAFIASLKTKYRFWWHIDAAFGGFAACTESHKHLLEGWQYADSITIDNHKWLNVPYDSAVIFTRKEHAALQVETFQNSNAPYLGNPLENFTYLNYGPENSRRFRALPAWFTLMAYGKKGYRDIVENNIAHAKAFGEGIEQSALFCLAAPVRLNTVCFTLQAHVHAQQSIANILAAMNKDGRFFVTPTMYKGVACIRAAFVNYRTTQEDVQAALAALHHVLENIK